MSLVKRAEGDKVEVGVGAFTKKQKGISWKAEDPEERRLDTS